MIFPNYNRSILSTTASILRHFGVNSLYPTLPEVDAALATGPKHVALVLADGAGVRPMEKNLPDSAIRYGHGYCALRPGCLPLCFLQTGIW